ncbi:hypothetical protein P9213_09050 [Geobacillus stearothermophilus]|uniref:hypothetical protein n=1 Tax=Geobacillus stearothermophilus TaxID=1422 RepID=UPI002E23ECA3|nr:hypothetical protein [Geobacillus stearothermophilus]MED4356793.1 hypothetical protein [Geobacillus stearothermophilus]
MEINRYLIEGVIRMEYSFEDLENDLEIGREIHFVYKGKEYSITHPFDGWVLSEFYKDYQTFRTHKELLEKGTINGKYLKEIWNDVKVTEIF